MKPKYILLLITLFNLVIWYGCVSDPDLPSDMINAKIPEIKTLEIEDNITATSATISAEVLKENGMPVIEYGAYWSKTTPIDTVNDKRVSAGEGKGVFSVTIEGLENNTLYYIAPFARNKKGIALGEEREVNTTTGLGTVVTLEPREIKATTVTAGGKIEVKGDGEILERGIYLAVQPDFSKRDSILSEMQTDSFVCHITDLSPDSLYYVKAFVKNNFGIFSGPAKSFKTTTGLSEISALKCLDIDIFQAVFLAEVTDEGDAPVTERGFCWKKNELPTIEDDKLVCSSGSGVFEGIIENLAPQTQYRIRAYAINKFGVSYSTDTTFFTKSDYPSVIINQTVLLDKGTATVSAEVLDEGQTEVVESGICWSSTNNNPTISDNKLAVTSGKIAFTAKMTDLKGDTKYYVRSYAKNQLKLSYSESFSFTTPPIYSDSNLPSLNKIRTQGSTSFFYYKNGGYVLGGKAGSSFTNELWLYDPVLNLWIDQSPYPESNVEGQTAIYSNKKAFVFGGKKAGQPINKFYTYDTYNNVWNDKTDFVKNLPDPIAYTAGCILDQKIFYIGGLRTDSVCRDVWMCNVLTGWWEQKTNLPEAQQGGIAFVFNNTIYAGLGLTNEGYTNKKLWTSADEGNSWNPVAAIFPNDSSKIIGGVVYADMVYVIDEKAQIWQYSPQNTTWKKKSRLTVLNDNVHCIFVLNDQIESESDENDKIYIGLGLGSSKFITYDPYWDN